MRDIDTGYNIHVKKVRLWYFFHYYKCEFCSNTTSFPWAVN